MSSQLRFGIALNFFCNLLVIICFIAMVNQLFMTE